MFNTKTLKPILRVTSTPSPITGAGNYVLQYLMTPVGLSPNVVQKLVQLVSKITKHGWFDNDKAKGFLFRDISDEVHKFLRVRWHVL